MTFEEMVAQIPKLSVSERKRLINVIVDSPATPSEPKPQKKRISNLHKGLVSMSDDFDAPLKLVPDDDA